MVLDFRLFFFPKSSNLGWSSAASRTGRERRGRPLARGAAFLPVNGLAYRTPHFWLCPAPRQRSWSARLARGRADDRDFVAEVPGSSLHILSSTKTFGSSRARSTPPAWTVRFGAEGYLETVECRAATVDIAGEREINSDSSPVDTHNTLT